MGSSREQEVQRWAATGFTRMRPLLPASRRSEFHPPRISSWIGGPGGGAIRFSPLSVCCGWSGSLRRNRRSLRCCSCSSSLWSGWVLVVVPATSVGARKRPSWPAPMRSIRRTSTVTLGESTDSDRVDTAPAADSVLSSRRTAALGRAARSAAVRTPHAPMACTPAVLPLGAVGHTSLRNVRRLRLVVTALNRDAPIFLLKMLPIVSPFSTCQ